VLFLLPGPLGAVRDAGTTQIVFPNGEIPYRHWMLPLNVEAQAVVKNFGDSAASFQVQLRIDTALVGTSQVTDLPPQESVLVQFPVLLPESGIHSIACSTTLAGDVQSANDRLAASFETFESGLSVTFFAPHGTVQVGDTVTPLVLVGNFSGRSEEAVILLTISRLADSLVAYESVDSVYLEPLEEKETTFSSWRVPDSIGVYKCLQRIGRMPLPLLDTLSWFISVARSGVEERETPDAGRISPIPTIVRGVLELPSGRPGQSTTGQTLALLLDATGRRVAALHRGRNDVTRFPPGVYFVRLQTRNYAENKKLILTR
jgi:hypothetical protein